MTHRPGRSKLADRIEEVELASVHLEIKAHVSSTWESGVEPDAYVTDLQGDILLPNPDADDDICIGKVSAYSVHFGEASEDGVSWFDVLDARSADTALYADLIDRNESWYTQWVEATFEPISSDLLILDRIRIEPEYRAHGYGLYAAQLMINGFASNGIVACVPAPYELLKDAPPRQSGENRRSSGDKRIPGWARAEAKLREYWSLLGFRQLPASDVFALSLTHKRPSMQEIMRKYVVSKRRAGSTTQVER